MSHIRSSKPSMLSSWKAEQGMELGIRAMASTSSTLHTSILLYTYLRMGTAPSLSTLPYHKYEQVSLLAKATEQRHGGSAMVAQDIKVLTGI